MCPGRLPDLASLTISARRTDGPDADAMLAAAARAMLVLSPPLVPHDMPRPRRCCVNPRLCAADGAGGDALLMDATAALRDGEASRARSLLSRARDAYEAQAEGVTEEQRQLLDLVGQRVDAAVVPGFGRTVAARPAPPSEEELKERADAKARGERALMLSAEAAA